MKDALGLYIHIPFCRQKCLYCDFPSYAGREGRQEDYVAALLAEIRRRGGENAVVSTVFFGGGTPTVLSPAQLKRILDTIKACFFLAPDAEITIEANPGTLDESMARALRQIGFNRLSMGVQAWQNRLLRSLGRIHTIEEFQRNFRTVRAAGFQNINSDLMFALPGQSMADWQETLRSVIALAPEHISAYSLILEEGTPFFEQYQKGLLQPVSEELDREMYWWAVDFLEQQGYRQYEISNFAKEGRQSRHNRIYWQAEEYLGFGLGAHSYRGGKRFHNTYDLEKYIAAHSDAEQLTEDIEMISETDAMAELMFLGLRLTEGVCFARFRERFGREMREIYGTQIDSLKRDGLLHESETGIRLTRRGIDVSNFVFEKFLL